MTFKIVKAVQTCLACPSQWDAWTDDGKYVYMRYRHGQGRASMFDSIEASEKDGAWFNPDNVIASFRHGHPLDGDISLHDFCKHAGLELDLHADIQNMKSYTDWDYDEGF